MTKYIKTEHSYKLSKPESLDSRLVVNSIEERDALVTNGEVYDSMEVYVKNDKKYKYNGSTWVDADYQTKIDNKLSTDEKTIVKGINELNNTIGTKPNTIQGYYEKVTNICDNKISWDINTKDSDEGNGLADLIYKFNNQVIRIKEGLHGGLTYSVNFNITSGRNMVLTINFYKRDRSNETGYLRYNSPITIVGGVGEFTIPVDYDDLLSISVDFNGSYTPNIKIKDGLLVVETVSDYNKEISLSEVTGVAELGDYVVLVNEKTINSTGLYKYIENKTDECIKKTDGVNVLSINSTEQQYANAKATYLHIEERINSIQSAKKVWNKPLLNLDTTELNTVYYYQTGDNAWINKLWIPPTQDYEPGVYAYFDGIKWLTFNVVNITVPALSQKDVYKFYVLYDEKQSKCQSRAVEIATGTDSAIGGWSNIITRDEKPEGAIEVVEERYDRLGVWYKTVYLGDNKTNCFDITVPLSQDETGHLTTDDVSTVIDENSTNLTIPTSKAVYDKLQNIAIPSTEPTTKVTGSIWLV